MSLRILFRHIKSSPAVKEHVEEKIKKISKIVTYPTSTQVILSLERNYHCAEITFYAEHRDLVAVAKTKDLYESIDLAVHKIEHQLKKYREIKKGHKRGHFVTKKAERWGKDIGDHFPHVQKSTKF